MKKLLFFVTALAFMSCGNKVTPVCKTLQPGVPDSLTWKPLKEGLYINHKGDLAFRVDYASREGTQTGYWYYTHFDFNDTIALNTVIDTASFRQLNGSFYKDKNHIYQYFAMAGGGRFSLFGKVEPGLDYTTFKVLNGYYAKDKNQVYDSRMGHIDGADARSFTAFGDHPVAKDKNHYYQWNDTITLQEIKTWEKDNGIKIEGL